MAIKCELSADRDRGPGHGILRITGLPRTGGPVDFSLMRNQGNQPWLGPARTWLSTETWLAADDVESDGDALLIRVGADVIDPIVSQPTTVAYRLSVAVGTDKQAGILKVYRPLLGSGASAPDTRAELERQQREEAERRAREEEELRRKQEEERRRLQEEEERRLRDETTRLHVPEPEPQPPAPEAQEPAPAETPRRSRLPLLVAALALLLLAGGGVGAWYGCLIPGFGAPRCAAPAEAMIPPPAAPASTAAPAATCAGLSGAECYKLAQDALAEKRFDPARQLLQQASGLGSVEASAALGRMYDPQTWSAESSPAASANWETAVYWYEKAAQQGNGEALLGAGRLLCTFSSTEFERKQGRAYLEKAAAQGGGSEEVRKLLEQCKPS